MDSCLPTPSQRELQLQQTLRAHVEKTIVTRGYTTDDLAQRLQLLPVGVQNLQAKTWSVIDALRIAEALGIPLSVTLSFPSPSPTPDQTTPVSSSPIPHSQVLSFEAWCRENGDLREELIRQGIDCPHCDGTGTATCESCEHDTDCDVCHNGTITNPQDPEVLRAMKRRYTEQKDADLQKWTQWHTEVLTPSDTPSLVSVTPLP